MDNERKDEKIDEYDDEESGKGGAKNILSCEESDGRNPWKYGCILHASEAMTGTNDDKSMKTRTGT